MLSGIFLTYKRATMLARKVCASLIERKRVSNEGTATHIEGARRVGKGMVIEVFALAEYEDHLLLGFSWEVGSEEYSARKPETSFASGRHAVRPR